MKQKLSLKRSGVFLFLFIFSLFFLPLASSIKGVVVGDVRDVVNIVTGNLTALSQLTDTNIPSPNDNEVLTYDTASGLWESQASVGGSGITWATATNGTLAELSTLLGFSYYNATSFDIADYYLLSNPYGYYNTTDFSITDYYTKSEVDTNITYENTTMKAYVDAVATGITWATATNGTLTELTTLLNFDYYNATDFDIADYPTLTELLVFDYYNSTDFSIDNYYTKAHVDTNITYENTTMKAYVDAVATGITWATATNGTLAELSILLGFSYYNATSFDIADYYLLSNPYGYYNTTNFDIEDYYTKAHVNTNITYENTTMKAYVDANVGIDSWGGNFTGYSNTTTILSWNYFNLTDFNIANYYLLSNPYGYYNTTNFDITDYYTKAEVTTNITSANTTMKGYVDAQDTSFNNTMKSYVDANAGIDSWGGNFTDYSNTTTILEWDYFNLTDFDIADYPTLATILGFNYYNLTDFNINNYLLNSNVTLVGNYSSTIDFCIAGGICLSATSGSGISWATATNGTLAEMSDILGFNYFNLTDFNIANYYNKTEIDTNISYENTTMKAYVDANAGVDSWGGNFTNYSNTTEILGWDYYNLTDFNIANYYNKTEVNTNISYENTTMKAYVDAVASGITWATATNGTLAEMMDVLGFNYYNLTSFNIDNYLLNSNVTLAGNRSTTVDYCIAGGSCLSEMSVASGISWAEATNGTLVELITLTGFNYYNTTDFNIVNYYNKTEVDANISYENTTMKAYVDATASGITWATATNGTLVELTTLLGFNYYNLTDFNIDNYMLNSNVTLAGNYSATVDYCIAGGLCLSGSGGSGISWAIATNGTLAEMSDILGFNYFNLTDFNIANYYNKTEVNTNISYENTTMKAYVDAQDTSFNNSIRDYADVSFANLTGDTFTGNITIGNNCIVNSTNMGSICHNGTGWVIVG